MPRRAAWLALALAGTTASVGPGGLLAPDTPHAAYVFTLQRSRLADSSAGRAWLRAAEGALVEAAAVDLPVRRTAELGAGAASPEVLSFRVTVPRGRSLSIAARFESDSAAPLFVDLFRAAGDGRVRRVASLAAGRRSLVHDVDAAGDYIVRAQTVLAAAGAATIAVRTLASLPFPVAGGRVQSGFGVARDAGLRQHEGIDIFAPRGTPVRAVAAGIARAGRNRLGGTVVWLDVPARRRSYYYAHLDRHAVGPMAIVAAGDVLGYVGNTGNARTTPPHLHFGIYENGAIDPWPFVQPDQPIPPERPARGRPADYGTGREPDASDGAAAGRSVSPVSPRDRRRPRSGRRRRA